MLPISPAVEKITRSSPIAFLALTQGYLNLSAYAKSILSTVEAETKKPVRLGSIVVALSRLSKKITSEEPLLPTIGIEDISVKSGLVEISFEKTEHNLQRLLELYKNKTLKTTDFFTVTHGINELTFIVTEKIHPLIIAHFHGIKPTNVMDNLVSLSLRLSENYLKTPNVIYALVQDLGLHRVNIIEIVSTFTEMSFIVCQADMQAGFTILNERLRKNSL